MLMRVQIHPLHPSSTHPPPILHPPDKNHLMDVLSAGQESHQPQSPPTRRAKSNLAIKRFEQTECFRRTEDAAEFVLKCETCCRTEQSWPRTNGGDRTSSQTNLASAAAAASTSRLELYADLKVQRDGGFSATLWCSC